ncbi:hypothetical protein AVEN_126551-1 [Araneus ventricosus]|uniref:Uncharacterized protein n=1 Tax=Araneus ventricosus TaxID=182803 RepID=A0A4Y2HP55_ARAVE|nr:hypothetical protein AVEN_126551-1 [Araneus ventricosus]
MNTLLKGRDSLRSRLRRVEGSRFETRFHRRSAVYLGPVHVKSDFVEHPLTDVVRKFEEGRATCGSKLRDSSQNSPRVGLKRDVNVSKVNKLIHYLRPEKDVTRMRSVSGFYF